MCNIMVRKGWLSGEEGGHQRLSGISMYGSPKCNFILNYFYVVLLNIMVVNIDVGLGKSKTSMSRVCNIMVRKGWLSGEEGGHHRLSGISMYASPKCNFIMNYFYVV